MSFFGKNFKKVKFENIDEFLEKNKIPEKTGAVFKNSDSITRYEKNADGTVQLISSKDGEVKWSQKIDPNVETEIVTPHGVPAKIRSQVGQDGNSVSSVLTLQDGFTLHFNRVYENNTLKQIISRENDDLKAVIYYEAV